MSDSKILVMVTGSIAAYKACEVVSQLVQLGHRVRVVASDAALRFVGEITWEGLTNERVLTDLFAVGQALEHIQLTRWADAVLVCPATANTLNRLAAGLADDLVGAIFLARDPAKPFLVAPAMNPAMWAHPATAAARQRLEDWGVRLISVGNGRTACGEMGLGRLAEPDAIVAAVTSALRPAVARQRVLVTAGATTEPIDAVRFISNLSTGETGAGIARSLWARGHEVFLLRGRGAARAEGVAAEEFGSTAEFAALLREQLARSSFDAVIHAAAVSDFTVSAVESDGLSHPAGWGKLPSASAVTIRLERTPKLVESLRAQSRNPAIKVIAFKLTAGSSESARYQAVRDLLRRSGADLVVANDLAERTAAGKFPADLLLADGTLFAHCADRGDIAGAIEDFLLHSPRPASSHAPVS